MSHLTPPGLDTPQGKRYKGTDGAVANPHIQNVRQHTILKSIGLELRAADCHLFVVTDPAYAPENDNWQLFMQVSKTLMGQGRKLLTISICRRER